jgi:hypothetical protein
MGYEDKLEEYVDVSNDMSKDLKHIFDRLTKKSDDYIKDHNTVDTDVYAPTCGITKRIEPLSPAELNELERQIEITKTTIKDNPDDYAEIKGMMPVGNRTVAGEGRGSNKGMVRIKKMPFPQWMESIDSNVQNYLNPKKGRKGMDYEAAISGRIRKAKEKLIVQDNSLYVILDTSGSMEGYTDKYGNPLLKVFSSFFPTIAERYKGQIWMVDDAPKDTPIPLQNTLEIEDFKTQTQLVTTGGGGTSFWGAFQIVKKKEIEVKEKNPDAKVMVIVFSDMGVDVTHYPQLLPESILFVTVDSISQYDKNQIKEVVDAAPETRKLISIDTNKKM